MLASLSGRKNYTFDFYRFKLTAFFVLFLLSHTYPPEQQKKKANGPTDPQQPAKKRPPTTTTDNGAVTTATTSGTDPELLKQQIEAQGNKVRDLKSSGADKV